MSTVNRLAEIGTLVGDPTRAAMLEALMDGRALTASELARAAGVTAQTASGHLSQLATAGLLSVEKQGRHRYHRLAGSEVARLLESLMEWTAGAEPKMARAIATIANGPEPPVRPTARSCARDATSTDDSAREKRIRTKVVRATPGARAGFCRRARTTARDERSETRTRDDGG